MTCPRCQRPVSPVDVFCGSCHAKVASWDARPASASPRPRPTATGGRSAEAPARPRPGAAASAESQGRTDVPPAAGGTRAGLLRRGVAYLVDAVVLGGWLLLVAVVVAGVRVGQPLVPEAAGVELFGPLDPAAMAPWVVAAWLPIAGLYAVAFVALEGATPGKMVLRLRVQGADGGPVGLREAVIREGVGALLTALTAGLAHLAAAVSPEGRAFHDRAGGTVVVLA
jgi:uncharacterized RDD family membrane protein YckC